jgi:methionyl aminopeptidase
LCLAISDTDASNADTTGLEYSKIKKLLYGGGSPATTRIAILDCCFSGRIIGLAATEGQFADLSDVAGTYTLTAADDIAHVVRLNQRADTYTSFTGELLELIYSGIPGGPNELTFSELYPRLRHRLVSKNLPKPNQRGTDNAAQFVFTRNAATHVSHEQPEPQLKSNVFSSRQKESTFTRQSTTSTPDVSNLADHVKNVEPLTERAMAGGGVRAVMQRLRGDRTAIELKSPGEIEAMRAAGAVVARTLRLLDDHARAGVSTHELDQLAEQTIQDAGAVPSYKGYHGFPASICSSVNEQVLYGVPSRQQVLADGDLLSISCGAILDRWSSDAVVTVHIGTAAEADTLLCSACRAALEAGIVAARPRGRLTDISHAVESAVLAAAAAHGTSYGIVVDYGGHGIGTAMTMDPFLPNAHRPGRGPRLVPGMALGISPIITAGSDKTKELDEGWAVVTVDGSRAAHWKHTVAVTDDGPLVLTVE